ncbi:MAG: hypothetical protein ACPGU0_03525 [Marinirhabdus sp.]
MKQQIRTEIQQLAKALKNTENNFEAAAVKKTVAKLMEKLTVLEYLEGQLSGHKRKERPEAVHRMPEGALPQKKQPKNDLETFAKEYTATPVFERKTTEEMPAPQKPQQAKATPVGKTKSLNDLARPSAQIGLNDKLAFIKHLFNGSTDDYKRVLSQIDAMQGFEEASTFIKGRVKPQYNYWLHKDEYTERFMAIVEKKFN